MSDNRGIGTRRKGKKPKEGHASSSSQRAVATGTQRLDISNVEPEEELEWGKIKILAESGVVNSGRSVKGKETMKKPDGEKGKEVGSPAKKQKQHGDIQSSSEPSRKIKIMAESGVVNSGRSVKGKETMKKPDSEKGKEVGSSAKKQKQQSYGDIQNSSEQRRRFVRARAFKLGPWLKFSKPCTCEYLVSRGWEGGGLGLRGDGIIDPIKAFQRPFDDQCFWDFRYEEKLWGFGYEEKLWGFGYEEKHGGRREERRKRRKEEEEKKRRKEEEEKRREEEVKKREKKQMEKERQKGKEKRYPQVKIFCWPREKKEKEKEKEKQKEKEKEKQKEKEKEKPSLSLQAYESDDEV